MSAHSTKCQDKKNASLKLIYHAKILDFAGQILEKADIDLLLQGRYEEVGLSSTNIKRFGLIPFIPSQETLINLDIEEDGLESDVVKTLGEFRGLQTLNAARNYFKDNDMEIIGNSLAKLQDLNICYNLVTATGIGHLRRLNELESFDCGFMKLGNEGIRYISEIKSLKRVYVRATGLDDEALESFLTMPNLELIDISQNKISPEALFRFTLSIKAEVIADHLLKE